MRRAAATSGWGEREEVVSNYTFHARGMLFVVGTNWPVITAVSRSWRIMRPLFSVAARNFFIGAILPRGRAAESCALTCPL